MSPVNVSGTVGKETDRAIPANSAQARFDIRQQLHYVSLSD